MATRREFLQRASLIGAGILTNQLPVSYGATDDAIMTVMGPIKPSDMGFTLTHEHILLGAPMDKDVVYDAEDICARMLPLLQDIKARGCATFVDCTPSNLGRNVSICLRLSKASGLNILTPTGYYGAGDGKHLPAYAQSETAQQLADRWIEEWKNGIGVTGIRPGFIKTSVDNGPITPIQRKLMEAAAITHLSTGLTIAVHTGDGKAAIEELEILKRYGVSPSARIWVHAGEEPDFNFILAAAREKSWVSLDHVNASMVEANMSSLKKLRDEHLLDQVLVSQDAGFYQLGKPNGGSIKPFTFVQAEFIPMMKTNGFTKAEIDKIFVANPAKAFAVSIRKL